MNTSKPRIIVSVNHARIAAAEDREEYAGAAIAGALRLMADQIEERISVIPYGSGEWVREVHRFTDADSKPLGALSLYEA